MRKQNQINPVSYFELPVEDLDRAIEFYSTLFGFAFERTIVDGYSIAYFPFSHDSPGITGALAKGDVYKPTKDGVIIYFNVCNIDQTLEMATQYGAKILYPKTIDQDNLYAISEIEDSEGNRIALRQLF